MSDGDGKATLNEGIKKEALSPLNTGFVIIKATSDISPLVILAMDYPFRGNRRIALRRNGNAFTAGSRSFSLPTPFVLIASHSKSY